MPDLWSLASIRPAVGCLGEYERAKRLLDKGRHPAFVGRDLVARCANNGGLIFFRDGTTDAAVAMVQTRRSVLLVLCVHPSWRGKGVGKFCLGYLKPNFVRAVEHAVPYFEANGYTRIGEWKGGVKLRTRVMVRSALVDLAGRLRARVAQ